MKIIILIPVCFLFIFCSNQMKLNKGNEVDIILPQGTFPVGDTGKAVEYSIKNNTENTYIIDPLGFYGYSYVLENNKIIEPYMKVREMHYNRHSDDLCLQDLIILKPKESIHVPLNLNINSRGIYNYSKVNKYIEVVKSYHNIYNATLLGCENYIKNLEKQGYKVLEDSINAKIPLIP